MSDLRYAYGTVVEVTRMSTVSGQSNEYGGYVQSASLTKARVNWDDGSTNFGNFRVDASIDDRIGVAYSGKDYLGEANLTTRQSSIPTRAADNFSTTGQLGLLFSVLSAMAGVAVVASSAVMGGGAILVGLLMAVPLILIIRNRLGMAKGRSGLATLGATAVTHMINAGPKKAPKS